MKEDEYRSIRMEIFDDLIKYSDSSYTMINCPMCGSKASVQKCSDVLDCADIGCENDNCLLYRLVEMYPVSDHKGIMKIVDKWNSMGNA